MGNCATRNEYEVMARLSHATSPCEASTWDASQGLMLGSVCESVEECSSRSSFSIRACFVGSYLGFMGTVGRSSPNQMVKWDQASKVKEAN
jgi:hypothetical protein